MKNLSKITFCIVLGFSAMLHTPKAHALDGCKILLCLAGPWASIAACVPDVRQLFKDLAKGKPFPTCSMSGGGNSAMNTWIHPQSNCPPQYTIWSIHQESGQRYISGCTYSASISTTVNGQPWSRVYWSFGGNTVTEYSSTAKAQMGNYADAQFDTDYAAWLEAERIRLEEEERKNRDNGGN